MLRVQKIDPETKMEDGGLIDENIVFVSGVYYNTMYMNDLFSTVWSLTYLSFISCLSFTNHTHFIILGGDTPTWFRGLLPHPLFSFLTPINSRVISPCNKFFNTVLIIGYILSLVVPSS